VHRETLTALIDAKATGRTLTTEEPAAGVAPAPDLLSALRASIEAAKQRRSTGNGGRRRSGTASTVKKKEKKPAEAGGEARPPKKRS
jgi:DNA end-binding protein Ku